jgi:acetyltransferase-like isoleucine patch superfamily enzyme
MSGLTIGDNALIGASSKIITTSHNFNRTDIPIAQQGLNAKPVTIEEDVWFGFNSTVLGGSIIRKGSIIAAGTVVTGGEFPSYAIIAGTPAQVKKSRLDAE